MKKRYEKYITNLLKNNLLIVKDNDYYLIGEPNMICYGFLCLDINYTLSKIGEYCINFRKTFYWFPRKYKILQKFSNIIEDTLKKAYPDTQIRPL